MGGHRNRHKKQSIYKEEKDGLLDPSLTSHLSCLPFTYQSPCVLFLSIFTIPISPSIVIVIYKPHTFDQLLLKLKFASFCCSLCEMDMDAQLVGSATSNTPTKGKRSRRHRLRPLISSSSSSSASANSGDHIHHHHLHVAVSFNSSTSTTPEQEEDHDLANCLILLAQGPNPPSKPNTAGFFVYECKTCNKTFPSFQALGGHRASHKKPKLDANKDKKPHHYHHQHDVDVAVAEEPHFRITPQIHFPSPPTKVHECSICGSEFTSGQALGGHMRRHRPSSAAVIKPTNVLQLDLNLPAPPEDDLRDSNLHFALPAPPLVDCHY